MARPRSGESARRAVAVDAAVHALAAAELAPVPSRSDAVSISIDGRHHRFRVTQVAYCTGQRARDLVAGEPKAGLVVAEKITADGRAVLSDAGWSWLDRRGRLHVRAPGVRVDIDVPPDPQLAVATAPDQPITGRSGLTVAYWLCQHPGETLSP